ncbi:MAG: choice-of-anchor D domain-containing protein [Acidobacteria bacterium]|nr:MAG: choice-of-anchor D domain-containing protein [Acidobacteriota bacterium]
MGALKVVRVVPLLLCAAVAAGAQSFVATAGPMTQARSDQAAVVLNSGKVLLAGGVGSETQGALASAELFDPSSSTFSRTGSMATARGAGVQAQLLRDGSVMVMGGGALGTPITSDIYHPATGNFSAGPDLSALDELYGSARLNDGRIFLLGSATNCTAAVCPMVVYLYDPRTQQLAPGGSLQDPPVERPAIVTLDDGKVLIYNGFPAAPGPTSPTNDYWIYDPSTGTAAQYVASTIPVAGAAAVKLKDGTVLICGGGSHDSGFHKECELYDPANNTVRYTTGTMAEARNAARAVLLDDGRALIAGGLNLTESGPDVEIYNPQIQTFSSAGNFNTERSEFSASLLANGSVLFAGGLDDSLTALKSAEVFQSVPVLPGFSLSADTTIATVNTGSAATFHITVQGSSGFSGSIALGCSGNNALTCAFAPATLSPGATSTLTVTGFNLSAGGLVKFSVTGTSGSTTHTLALAIALEPPKAVLAPAALSFGHETTGHKSDAQTVSLSNGGEGTLQISTIATSGPFSETNDCPASIDNGAPGCTITVQFAPVSAGAQSGTLTISDDAPFSPQAVQLSGTGFAPPAPAVTLSVAQLQFAAQAVGVAGLPQPVMLTNSGSADLTLTSIAASGDFQENDNCPATLAASKSCTVQVVFKPMAAGSRGGTLVFTDNAPNSPQSVALAGMGEVAASPGATLTPASLTFAAQALSTTSAAQTVTLGNATGDNLVVNAIGTGGDFAATNNCPVVLAPQQSCVITVTFTPTAMGQRTSALSVNAGGVTYAVPLAGTGIAGAAVAIKAAPGGSAAATVNPGDTAA